MDNSPELLIVRLLRPSKVFHAPKSSPTHLLGGVAQASLVLQFVLNGPLEPQRLLLSQLPLKRLRKRRLRRIKLLLLMIVMIFSVKKLKKTKQLLLKPRKRPKLTRPRR